MLRTHSSAHTFTFCLALAFASGACSPDQASEDTPPTDIGLDGQIGGGGRAPASLGSEEPAGDGSSPALGEAGESSASAGAAGSAPSETSGDTASGGTASGGTASGGTASGGTASGGAAGAVSGHDAAIVRGRALASKNMCTTCHQQDYSGLAIYANITPDLETGIGSWSDQEIGAAIREQKGKDNATLCNLMVPFPFTDAEVGDLVAFLRSLPPISNQITVACPGHVP